MDAVELGNEVRHLELVEHGAVVVNKAPADVAAILPIGHEADDAVMVIADLSEDLAPFGF